MLCVLCIIMICFLVYANWVFELLVCVIESNTVLKKEEDKMQH